VNAERDPLGNRWRNAVTGNAEIGAHFASGYFRQLQHLASVRIHWNGMESKGSAYWFAISTDSFMTFVNMWDAKFVHLF
jgi:hypothetical protein